MRGFRTSVFAQFHDAQQQLEHALDALDADLAADEPSSGAAGGRDDAAVGRRLAELGVLIERVDARRGEIPQRVHQAICAYYAPRLRILGLAVVGTVVGVLGVVVAGHLPRWAVGPELVPLGVGGWLVSAGAGTPATPAAVPGPRDRWRAGWLALITALTVAAGTAATVLRVPGAIPVVCLAVAGMSLVATGLVTTSASTARADLDTAVAASEELHLLPEHAASPAASSGSSQNAGPASGDVGAVTGGGKCSEGDRGQ